MVALTEKSKCRGPATCFFAHLTDDGGQEKDLAYLRYFPSLSQLFKCFIAALRNTLFAKNRIFQSLLILRKTHHHHYQFQNLNNIEGILVFLHRLW